MANPEVPSVLSFDYCRPLNETFKLNDYSLKETGSGWKHYSCLISASAFSKEIYMNSRYTVPGTEHAAVANMGLRPFVEIQSVNAEGITVIPAEIEVGTRLIAAVLNLTGTEYPLISLFKTKQQETWLVYHAQTRFFCKSGQ